MDLFPATQVFGFAGTLSFFVEFFLEFCEDSIGIFVSGILSKNHHFTHHILVEESGISAFNSANIAETLSFFLELLSFEFFCP